MKSGQQRDQWLIHCVHGPTLFKVSDMRPVPRRPLIEVPWFFKLLDDQTSFMALKICSLFLQWIPQSTLNALVKVVWCCFTLNQNPQLTGGSKASNSCKDNMAQFFFGAKLIEGRLMGGLVK